MRFISIEDYVVTVEIDGKIKKYNCFAGEHRNINILISDLKQQVFFEESVKKMIGKNYKNIKNLKYFKQYD